MRLFTIRVCGIQTASMWSNLRVAKWRLTRRTRGGYVLSSCLSVASSQRHKSRHEELKERARLLLEQAKKQDAMMKSVTSSQSHGHLSSSSGGTQAVTEQQLTSPDKSTPSSECSPVRQSGICVWGSFDWLSPCRYALPLSGVNWSRVANRKRLCDRICIMTSTIVPFVRV